MKHLTNIDGYWILPENVAYIHESKENETEIVFGGGASMKVPYPCDVVLTVIERRGSLWEGLLWTSAD